MDRDRLLPLVLALLAVLALGAAAATLNTAQSVEEKKGSGLGGGGTRFDLGSPSIDSDLEPSPLLSLLLQVLMFLMLIGGLIGLALVIYREGFRTLLKLVPVVLILVVLGLLIYYALQRLMNSTPGQGGGFIGQQSRSIPRGSIFSGTGEVTTTITNEPSVALFVLLVIAIVIATIVLFRAQVAVRQHPSMTLRTNHNHLRQLMSPPLEQRQAGPQTVSKTTHRSRTRSTAPGVR